LALKAAALTKDLVDLRRQVEILGRQATGVVGGQREHNKKNREPAGMTVLDSLSCHDHVTAQRDR
jgi:hypothetical protein